MAQTIRVLHIIANLEVGGVERLLVKSLSVLNRTDFDHLVCCTSGGGIYENELRTLEIPYWIMIRRARYDPTLVFQLASLMRREHIDVVHTLNFTANAWGRAAAKIAGVDRIIAHERGTAWTENSMMQVVDKLFSSFTSLIVANSEATKIILTKRIGIAEDRIHVIHNGLPQTVEPSTDVTTLRARLGIDPQVPLIGTVGRMDTPKGHNFLLQAIPKVWDMVPDIHFVLIGDGPLRENIEAQARELGLSNNRGKFQLTGALPDAPDLMRAFDILVHPAIHESLGNVLIEAGLSGVPVIASNVDGCPEVIVEGQTGVLIDCTQPVSPQIVPGASPLPPSVVDGRTHNLRPPLGPNPEALADAIIHLLNNPHLRKHMGEQGKIRTQKAFSIERYVTDLESIYRGEIPT